MKRSWNSNSPVDDLLILWGNPVSRIGKAPEGHQLPHSQLHLDVIGLGQDGKTLGELLAFPFDDVLALKVYQSAVVGDQSGDHAHDGGLARAVGADQGNHLALGNGEAHAVHHGFPVILFCQFLYTHGHTFFLVRRR